MFLKTMLLLVPMMAGNAVVAAAKKALLLLKMVLLLLRKMALKQNQNRRVSKTCSLKYGMRCGKTESKLLLTIVAF